MAENTAKKQDKQETAAQKFDVQPRGRSVVGRVISDKMNNTVSVSWDRRVYIPKYERYLLKTSTVLAHNPDFISAKEGDMVRIQQCRPLSKLKNFVVVEKIETESAQKTE